MSWTHKKYENLKLLAEGKVSVEIDSDVHF